ncbi:MAG: hypothetical protein JSW61_11110, partial [Candidatus Thorarchaeota archaeon]
WVLGNPFYANQSLTFTVSVTGATAILSYTPPAIAPYGDNITFTVYYRDSATGNGISNGTGDVHISLVALNSTVSGPFTYSLQSPAPGEYVYTFNSTQWMATGSLYFELNVTWTDGVVPYFPDINGTEIRAVVRTIFTQLFTGVPSPGMVPAADNVTFTVTFYYLDRDEIIQGSDVETDWAYGELITPVGDGTFNITLYTSGIPSTGTFAVQVTANKSYYTTRSGAVSITVRDVNTLASATAPTPGVAPVGDNVTLHVGFYDTDHLFNITGASIVTDWAFGWNWVPGSSGGFDITLYTATVINLIQYDITFTMSKALHTDGIVVVRVEIRSVQTAISMVPPGDTPAGSDVSVVVTVTDLDHGTPVDGANIISTSPSYSWVPLVNGQYNITFYLWDQPFGTYTYDVTALKTNHDPASLNVDINLRQTRTTLYTDTSLMIVNWSELVDLAAYYDQEEAPVGPVPGATVVATLSGTDTAMTFNGSAYVWTIDTSTIEVGTYIITITANKTNFETRVLQVTLVVAVLETEFYPVDEVYSFTISSGTPVDINVYYGTLAFGSGIVGASVSYSWTPAEGVVRSGSLTYNGTPGYYEATINTTDTEFGIYTLYVHANRSSHAEASIYFGLEVREIGADLVATDSPVVMANYGDNATISVNYTAPDLGIQLTNAYVTFRIPFVGLTGNLTEVAPGIYNVTIDTRLLDASTFDIQVTASKPGFEVVTRTISLVIDPIASLVRVEASSAATITVYYEQLATYVIEYYDELHDLGIENASLRYSWTYGSGALEEIGNGIYQLVINSSHASAGSINYITVAGEKDNYLSGSTTLTLQVDRILVEVLASTSTGEFVTPVGDNMTVYLYLNDTIYNRPVLGASPSVTGDVEGSLIPAGNGYYTFNVPEYLAVQSTPYMINFRLDHPNYEVARITVEVIVRPIDTVLTADRTEISILEGDTAEILVIFTDVDHNLPITFDEGAVTIEVTSDLSEDVPFEPEWTALDEPGQYLIRFVVRADYLFRVTISASKGTNYAVGSVEIAIDANPVAVDLMALYLQYAAFGVVIVGLGGALLWVRVFSVPKVIRIINSMVKKLRKGRVPEPAPVSGRNELILDIVNEGLAQVGLSKPLEEMPAETIIAEAPEVEHLLAELAEITGLEEEDVQALRVDLSRMRASERPGFLMEVIKQERSRRAEAIAEKKKKKKVEKKDVVTEEDLEEIRQRLLKLGIAKEEVEILVEQAKSLSKAEIEALLDEMTSGLE